MSYTINDIELSDYGFIPTQAAGSNIAVEGIWDMSKRINKAFHDWGEEEGLEPYLESDELQWSGRDIKLHGVIKGDNEQDANDKAIALKHLLGNPTVLLTLDSDWGTWSVFHKKSEMSYLDIGVIEVVIHFREPVVAAPSAYVNSYIIGDSAPAKTFRESDGIDGVSFSTMGLTLLKYEDYLDVPSIKDMTFSSYENEGYQLRPPGTHEIVMNAGVSAVDITAFNSVLDTIKSALMAPRERYLTNAQDALALFFCTKGLQVNDVIVSEAGAVTALLQIPMIINKGIYPIWLDESGYPILDELNQPIYYGFTSAPVWRDHTGERIEDENNEDILIKTL